MTPAYERIRREAAARYTAADARRLAGLRAARAGSAGERREGEAYRAPRPCSRCGDAHGADWGSPYSEC